MTSPQAIAFKHHERLAVKRQVGARHSGKRNALCEKRLQEPRALELADVELLAGPVRAVYGFGLQQA
jgi:hypothetical protein